MTIDIGQATVPIIASSGDGLAAYNGLARGLRDCGGSVFRR